jgi:hypothetical protein
MSIETYPLWCIDTGEEPGRFIGPFGSERDAQARAERIFVRPLFRIRRCRASSGRTVATCPRGFVVGQEYVCEGDE